MIEPNIEKAAEAIWSTERTRVIDSRHLLPWREVDETVKIRYREMAHAALESQKKTFKVRLRETTYYEVEVRAVSEEEAGELAEARVIEDGDKHFTGVDDRTVTAIEEVTA